jgi:hypothetical protein
MQKSIERFKTLSTKRTGSLQGEELRFNPLQYNRKKGLTKAERVERQIRVKLIHSIL